MHLNYILAQARQTSSPKADAHVVITFGFYSSELTQ